MGSAILAGGFGAQACGQTAEVTAPPSSAATAAASPLNPTAAAPAADGIIKGTVLAGTTPLPGVAVTATDSATGKGYATSTDVDGSFQMAVPSGAHYILKTELAGFASTTQQIDVSAAGANGAVVAQAQALTMDLASRATPVIPASGLASAATSASVPTPANTGTIPRRGNAAARPAGSAPGAARGSVARVGRGTQSLTMQSNNDSNLLDATASQRNIGAQLPSITGADDTAAATDSIAVSGQQGQTNGLAGFSEDDLRNRIQDMQRNGMNNGDIAGSLSGVMQTGSFGRGGPGGGGPGGGEGFGGGGGRGGFGGGRGGGFGGGGFGGFRGQNPNAWHGTVGYSGSNSALDATPYSVTGSALPKPDSQVNSLVASFTGTPYIPHLLAPNPKQFLFFTISENRTVRPTTLQTNVPTLAQRLGDLTPSHQAGRVINSTTANGQVTYGQVYDPSTGQPYGTTGCDSTLTNVTACIPTGEISPAAKALLNYYPLPNVVSPLTQYNYQANFPGTSHSSQVSARYNRSFGAAPARGGRGGGGGGGRGGGGQNRNAPPVLRQSIAESFAYSHNASANDSFSSFLSGKSAGDGYNFTSSYTVGYGRLNSTASLSWNRSSSLSSNQFTFGPLNPAIGGISGNTQYPAPNIQVGTSQTYTNPFYFGLPLINIAGGIQSLGDTSPIQSVNQTISFSDFVSWSHKQHNMRYGFGFNRIHADSFGTGGDLGSFTFSDFATEIPSARACTTGCPTGAAAGGSSFADFLLGLPQQSTITAGLNKIYLRGNSWNWYAQDDWRARNNLTFNFGLRWEYFSPYSEKYNRLVNLNVVGSGSSLQVPTTICGTAAPAGSKLGACNAVVSGPLVNPDKSLYSPRVSLAWSPKFKWTKNTVVRSSYGINYNTGQYSRFATNLAFQQPFSVTQRNVQSSGGTNNGCTLANMTLTNGFNCTTLPTQSSYAVDPNYRLGMVQVYNLGIQRTLPQGILLNIDYTGSYAGNLDMLRAPNRTPSKPIQPSAGQFTYEDSLGYQRSNALAINIRNRMHKGIALGASYTYSHSIDNASSVGGSGNSIAQNDADLGAEESNSSFDRRHVLNGNFVIEPPFGPNRAFFNKGNLTSHILDGFSISGNFTFASGGWATPQYSLTAQEIAAGAPSSLRPNRDPTQPIKGAGSHTQWFNTAAFVGPCDPANPAPYCLPPDTYGTAARNSIELPGTVSINGSLSRTVALGATRSIEFRVNANNALNTVQYSGVDTTLNSQTIGQVTSAAPMRSLSYNARFRF